MRTGSVCGDDRRCQHGEPVLSVGLFLDDEGGFTTVAVAMALLLTLTLAFSTAAACWTISKSAEVQRVADAAAMAGENTVAAYATVAQVLDACVLSMGLAGLVVWGAGLVTSCVPGLTAVGAEICDAASSILSARRSFASTAATGLERLEATLPLLVIANSAATVAANCEGGASYVGCALPFPVESASDFSSLAADVDDSGLSDLSEEMCAASEEVAEAKERADEALYSGWYADCGSTPRCLRERASTLAGLAVSDNPDYPSVDGWTFGAPLLRARAYYAVRLETTEVAGSTAEELTDTACRKAFFAYALAAVRAGSFSEASDGSVSIDLPSLPRTASDARQTTLYTDSVWPCTIEEAGRTLHSTLLCPGATGTTSGTASLAELESGLVLFCDTCQMDIGEMGRVASASTVIDNGFEYYWRTIVEASKDYEQARNDQAEAEQRLEDLADKGKESFAEALSKLTVARPELCPPGAYGAVAVVVRSSGEVVPTELTASFVSSTELPSGAAVSAAVLAPDSSTSENNVLATFLDSISAGGSVVGGVLDGVLELWGSLLVGYGSTYDYLSSAGSSFLDGIDNVLGGTVGSWLKSQLKQVMQAAGLEPCDMRLRKPVLVGTEEVLVKSGYDQASSVRTLVETLPESGSIWDFASSMGQVISNQVGSSTFTVAELTIPGTSISIPLTIDLSSLLGGSS